MTPEACVYYLMDERRAVSYIGVTSKLKSRISSHCRKPYFASITCVSARFFPTRREACAYEAAEINRVRPSRNETFYNFCEVLSGNVSGGYPLTGGPMDIDQMAPGWRFFPPHVESDGLVVWDLDRSSDAALGLVAPRDLASFYMQRRLRTYVVSEQAYPAIWNDGGIEARKMAARFAGLDDVPVHFIKRWCSPTRTKPNDETKEPGQ